MFDCYDKEALKDIYDEDGKMKDGVQVFGVDEDGKQDDITGSYKEWSSTEPKIEVREKGEEEKKPDDWLDDSYSGDYCDLRNMLRTQTRDELIEFLQKTDRRRIIQLREHLLLSAAYNKTTREESIQIALTIVRGAIGDWDIPEDEEEDWYAIARAPYQSSPEAEEEEESDEDEEKGFKYC